MKYEKPKSIYYAHSKKIYDTKQEELEIDTINKYFDNALLVNPNGCIIQDISEYLIMEQCLRLIKSLCTTVVFTSIDNGYIGKGVYTELLTADKEKLEIYYLKDNKFYEINVDKNIQVLENNDSWIKYATVKLK